MTTDEQTAAKIVEDHMNSVCETSMESAIVAVLEAARREVTDAARGSIIDCTGEVPCVRRVMGTLPVTADECVVGLGDGAQLWMGYWHDFPPDCGGRQWIVGQWNHWRMDGEHLAAIARHHSTESAAKAAMEGGK